MRRVETCVGDPKSLLTTGIHASSAVFDDGTSDIRNAVGIAPSEEAARQFVDQLSSAAGQQCLGDRVVDFFTAMTTKPGSTLPAGLIGTPMSSTLTLGNGVPGYQITLPLASRTNTPPRIALRVDVLPVQRGKAVVVFGAVSGENEFPRDALNKITSSVLARL